jgi:hypothetical protein
MSRLCVTMVDAGMVDVVLVVAVISIVGMGSQ